MMLVVVKKGADDDNVQCCCRLCRGSQQQPCRLKQMSQHCGLVRWMLQPNEVCYRYMHALVHLQALGSWPLQSILVHLCTRRVSI